MDTPRLLCLFFLTLMFNACAEKNTQTEHSGEKLNEAAQLQNTFTKPILELPSDKHNVTHIFGIKNCHVYKAVQTQNIVSDWQLLFKPAPYALPKTCVRERLEMEGEYLHIEIGTQAMGAGGCCTTYAAYRTLDGETWEIRPATSIKTWQLLDREN
ncbi:MAG: hypothetical protein ACSHXY_01360 [Alphaproteobacteria bacterium]